MIWLTQLSTEIVNDMPNPWQLKTGTNKPATDHAGQSDPKRAEFK